MNAQKLMKSIPRKLQIFLVSEKGTNFGVFVVLVTELIKYIGELNC